MLQYEQEAVIMSKLLERRNRPPLPPLHIEMINNVTKCKGEEIIQILLSPCKPCGHMTHLVDECTIMSKNSILNHPLSHSKKSS